ncbi:MAG: AAA family ATPase [Elusimicrobia bacterium]|nr:AAA family ATPase [Elusimicrobiota bacterium]
MLLPRLWLFLERNWLKLTVLAVFTIAVLLPIWYLRGMETNVRDYIIGINIASLPWGIFQTLIFVGLLYLLHYGGGFARFKKTKVHREMTRTRFEHVIGLAEAKREAWEVMQLIQDRTRVRKIGGKILRGVLMVGPPGCGKTLLAKAIATEAGIPFLSTAGSEFVEIFVGVGASRVRKLFRQARQYAKAYGACIVFIDELDVVGRQRVFNAFGGSEESNSTLNQLLVEMDGLSSTDANVVVAGATNTEESVLDPALLRPGRFDRKIYIGRPNLQEREQLFEFYLKKVKHEPVDIGRLARKAVYKTPAEIENIVKESALIAARNGKDRISYAEISEAVERTELGIAHRLQMTPHEREMTAYHEAGHLIVLYLHHPTSDVFKVSILQRGGTLGVVHPMPREEFYSTDRNSILAHIKVALAGYVSERIKYGVTTDGVRADFSHAMQYAHTMVWRYGMGVNGFVGDFSVIPKEELSDALKEKLNLETQGILKECMQEVEKILHAEWAIVERFAQELLQKEELDYDQITAIFAEYGKKPRPLPSTSLPLPIKNQNS